MWTRLLISVLAALFLLNCGGRTPPFTGDTKVRKNTVEVADSGQPPAPDSGFLADATPPWTPDSGLPPRLDTGIPPGLDAGTIAWPDASTGDCEFGPERVCSCPSGLMGKQSCQGQRYGSCVCWPQPPLPPLSDRELLNRITEGMIGSWRGIGENQWEGEYPVTFVFRQNGSYSANCPRADCTALYWGFDDDAPEKTYSVFDVFANGEGDGELVIGGRGWGPQPGELTNIYLSPGEGYMRFRFYNTWGGRRIGPLTFMLELVSD